MGFILRSPVKSKQQSWARVIMAVSPRSKLICTRNASNLWMSTKTAPSANLTSALPSTTLVNRWTRVSSTACWEKLVVDATLTTWSRCSKRRWPVAVRRRRKKHPHQLKKHPQKHPQKRPPMMVPRRRRRRRRPPSKKITNYTIVIFIYRSEFSSSCYPQLTSTTKNLEISEYNDLLKDHSRYKYNSHK